MKGGALVCSEWFESDSLRFEACQEAVLGFYGISRELLLGSLSTTPRKVFVQLLNVFRVSAATIQKLTGWDPLTVKNLATVVRTQGWLREKEQLVGCTLMRYILTATSNQQLDVELPEDSDCDYRNPIREALSAYDRLHTAFEQTPRGRIWRTRYAKRVKNYSSFVDVVLHKPGDEDRSASERWSENPANDAKLWECLRNFAKPVNWDGRLVFVARGYQLGLGLTNQEKQVFDNDGRVVLLRGKSAYAGAPPCEHCLIFPTAFAARSFMREQLPHEFAQPPVPVCIAA